MNDSTQGWFSSRLVTLVSKCGQLYIEKIEASDNLVSRDDILDLKKPIQEADDIKELKTTLSVVLRELHSRNIDLQSIKETLKEIKS